MLSHIIYSLSFKRVYIVYLGQKRGARAPLAPPSKSATDQFKHFDKNNKSDLLKLKVILITCKLERNEETDLESSPLEASESDFAYLFIMFSCNNVLKCFIVRFFPLLRSSDEESFARCLIRIRLGSRALVSTETSVFQTKYINTLYIDFSNFIRPHY